MSATPADTLEGRLPHLADVPGRGTHCNATVPLLNSPCGELGGAFCHCVTVSLCHTATVIELHTTVPAASL